MWGRSLWLALIAGVGAAIAWALAQPFLPYTPISNTRLEDRFTLGTTYGWLHNLLLGILICGLLSFLIAEPRTTPGRALVHGLLGAILGGGAVCGIDALSDFINIRLMKSGAPLELVTIDWYLGIAAAMSLSIALACVPTKKRLIRALIAAGIGAAGGFILRHVLAPIEVMIVVGKAMNTSTAQAGRMNYWALYSPSQLVQTVSMAIAMGLVLGFVEHFGREAWLRLELGRNEGRDYTLERQSTRIGSAEGADITLTGDPSLLPFHAEISEYQGAYSVLSLAGPVFVNGMPAQAATLKSGDMIGLGQFRLFFVQKSPNPHRAPASQPIYTPPAANAPVIAMPIAALPTPRLEYAGGLERPLAQGRNLLGRDPSSIVSLMTDSLVSRVHAEIGLIGVDAVVRDAGSRNGTMVNGQPLQGEHTLVNGDVIQVGSTKLTFRDR